MTHRILLCLIAPTLGLALAPGRAQEAAVSENAAESHRPAAVESGTWETITHITSAGQARRLAETLKAAYTGDPRIQFQQADQDDLVVLRVQTPIRGEVLGLLRALDRPPKLLEITIAFVQLRGSLASLPDLQPSRLTLENVGQVLANAEAAGQIQLQENLQITAVEGEPTRLHFGYPKRLANDAGPEAAGSTRRVHLGTLCGLTCRVAHDGSIYLKLDFARSAVREPDPTTQGTRPAEPPAVTTATTKTTLHLSSGGAQLISLGRAQPGEDSPTSVWLVGARLRAERAAGGRVPGTQPPDWRQVRPAPEPAAKPAVQPPEMEAKVRGYVRAWIRKYDQNGDGILQPDEWKGMARDPSAADVDGSGRIDEDELLQWLLRRNRR